MANHLHQPVISLGAWSYSHILWSFNANGGRGVWGQSPQRLAILGDLLPK